MKLASVLLLLILFTFSAKAQEKFLKDKAQTEQLSKQVAEHFYNNNAIDAMQAMAPYWPIPENEREALGEKTMKLMNVLQDRFGEPVGPLKVKTETIGDIAIRETYLVRYQNSAIRLIFTYYKNPKGWIINSFKWDDLFTEEFS